LIANRYYNIIILPLGALVKAILDLGADSALAAGAEAFISIFGTGRLREGRPDPEIEEVTAIPALAAAAPRNPFDRKKEEERKYKKMCK